MGGVIGKAVLRLSKLNRVGSYGIGVCLKVVLGHNGMVLSFASFKLNLDRTVSI